MSRGKVGGGECGRGNKERRKKRRTKKRIYNLKRNGQTI